MGQPLDQDVVNLAQAIRQVETGNRPVAGQSGELPSRYQFTPGTWSAGAQKYLGDPSAPLTLENENQVAYGRIKDWKDAGYGPDQIASMWNSGRADWRGNKGTNSAGVGFDTPAYVAKVGREYARLKGSAAATSAISAGGPSSRSPEDAASAKQYGAFFPADTSKPVTAGSAAEEALKTAGNVGSSAWSFVKSIPGALWSLAKAANPLNIPGNVSKIAEGVPELVREAGGAGKAAQAFGDAAAMGTFRGAVPKATQDLLEAAGSGIGLGLAGKDATAAGRTRVNAAIDEKLKSAQRTITNDPFGQVAPYIFAAQSVGRNFLSHPEVNEAELPPELNDTTESLKAQAEAVHQVNPVDQALEGLARTVTKPVGDAARAVGGAVSRATSFGASQATGLNPDTISQVVDNPEGFTPEARQAATRSSLGQEVQSALGERAASLEDTGTGYDQVRTGAADIKLQRGWLDKAIKDATGVDIGPDGTITTSGEASVRDPRDLKALQNLRETWGDAFDNGHMSANEFLNFRSDLSKLSKFGREISSSSDLEAAARDIRAGLNEAYRPQIEGLAETDAQYSQELSDIKRLSKGLVDKNGALTDAAINRIANAAGKGKDALLGRLEEISPGITDRIKALKAVEDIQAASGIKVGTYGRAAAIAGSYAFGGPIRAVVEAVLTSPDVAVPILRQYGLLKNSAAVQAVGQALLKAASGANAAAGEAATAMSAIPRVPEAPAGGAFSPAPPKAPPRP